MRLWFVKQSNEKRNSMIEKIIKRDGREVEYNHKNIENAILHAMDRTELGRDIPLAQKIAFEIGNSGKKKLAVEEVQDLAENKLMSSSRKDVAKHYITYRNERTKVRNLNKQLYEETRKVLECSNIDNTNANIDQHSFSGKENRIGAELHKQFANDNLLTERVKDAFEQHYIYIHDFDKYAIGNHNCLFADVGKLLETGFTTRNGDVRPANSVSSAFQLIAVIFQIQSQVQFGGVASAHIDYDVAPFVRKSFVKHFTSALNQKYMRENKISALSFQTFEEFKKWRKQNIKTLLNDNKLPAEDIYVSNRDLRVKFPDCFDAAYERLYDEGLQGAQALYHNLNTLESRAGAQVPFTSINYGRDISREGQLVTEWLLKASIEGIGKLYQTSIFPIGIFQYKKGVNDKPGTPNYYLKQLAIESMCKRIYPNWVNCDYSQHHEDPNDIDTIKATMGCRTQIGYDRHGLGYKQVGRGNICPTTILLPKLGIEYGICYGDRTEPDLVGFWKAFDKILDVTKESLLNRYAYISSQSPKSAPFMYQNRTIADADKCKTNTQPSIKHETLAIGFIGIAELCQALFGTNFVHDQKVYDFAIEVVKHIYDYAKQASDENNLNFSCYATPAEGLCEKAATYLKDEFGAILNVTDRKYLTNSSHVPVWEEMPFERKMELEQPFTWYETGGCITYGEFDSKLCDNPAAMEKIIDRAMELDIPYLAGNFPIDTCRECGYQGDIEFECPKCGNNDIYRIARVTGYLSTDVNNFNEGKQNEVKDRVTHEYTVDFGKSVVE